MEGKEWFYGFSEADLEGYARKTLSEETRLAMDRAIPQHEDLKKELVFRIQRYRLQINPEGFIWLDQLKNQPKRSVSKDRWRKIGISMAFLTVLLTAFWFYQTNAHAKTVAQRVEWVRQSIKAHPDRDVFSDNSSNGRLNQALEYYRNKKYKEAEPLFVQLLPALQDAEINVCIAICRLQMGQFNAAHQILKEVKLETQANEQIAIRWYLSLALAAADKPESVKIVQKYLSEIPMDSRYKNSADALLKKLSQ